MLGKLREEAKGVKVHGMLADLLLLWRQRDDIAASAALGGVLRNTIVVETRKDGARVVAAVKAAGIRGRVRCDVLAEMEMSGKTSTNRVISGGGGSEYHYILYS